MALSAGLVATLSEPNNPCAYLNSSNANFSPLNSLNRHFRIPWKNNRQIPWKNNQQLPYLRLDMNQRSYKGCPMVTCESTVSTAPTEWTQGTFELPEFKRGCHIITRHIYEAVPEIGQFEVGLANLFILHTSASLTINENASRDVPLDMEDALNRIIPEGNHYRHLDEGYDDMPAHVKASMMGCSLTIPVRSGRFHLGIWQCHCIEKRKVEENCYPFTHWEQGKQEEWSSAGLCGRREKDKCHCTKFHQKNNSGKCLWGYLVK